MKKLSILVFLIVLTRYADAQETKDHINNKEADQYWNTMPLRLPDQIEINRYNQDSAGRMASQMNYMMYDEMFKQSLRYWGMEFWRRFPKDPRRFKWLDATCTFAPAYFLNAREGAKTILKEEFIVTLDTLAITEWNKHYSLYLNEFLVSKEIDSVGKQQFLKRRLKNEVFHKPWRSDAEVKFNLLKYVDNMVAYAGYLGPEYVSKYLNLINRDRAEYGLDDDDISQYINLLNATGLFAFQMEALSMESLTRLNLIPLMLKGKSTDKKMIDLKDFKGKFVLVDFWSLGCPVCIERMPEIKTTYDKYKEKGFEVISVCFFNGKKEEYEKIANIHKRVGGEWPLILLNTKLGGKGDIIRKTYGFRTVPQLLFLDKEGKLLKYQGDLLKPGRLEKIIEPYF